MSEMCRRHTWRRGTTAATIVVVVTILALAACSDGTSAMSATTGADASATEGYCYRSRLRESSDGECVCHATQQSLPAADWENATACGATSSTMCCSDTDTNGYATTCRCQRARCYESADGECACSTGGFGFDVTDAIEVPYCEPSGVTCCGHDGYCGCSADRECSPSERTMTPCSPAAIIASAACADGETRTTSCDSVQFRAPAPSSSSSSSGSTTEKECTTDGQCSSKCSGDCYGCRSNTCRCGRRGVSGGCLL